VVGAIQTAYRSAILIRYAKNNYKKMVMNKEGKKHKHSFARLFFYLNILYMYVYMNVISTDNLTKLAWLNKVVNAPVCCTRLFHYPVSKEQNTKEVLCTNVPSH